MVIRKCAMSVLNPVTRFSYARKTFNLSSLKLHKTSDYLDKYNLNNIEN